MALTTPDPKTALIEAHDDSSANVFPRLGETGTARDILDRLERRSA
jgi:hypothetical protein